MNIPAGGQTDETDRKKRIQFYKTILNYYRGRSLSLEAFLASKQPNLPLPANGLTYKELCKNTQLLLDDITLIQSLKDCMKVLKNSLTCAQFNNLNIRLDGKITHKLEGVICYSKSLMKLYEERYSELDLFKKKISYTAAFSEYGKKLEMQRKNQRSVDSEDAKSLERAELQVYKVNLIRAMKAVLIGFITVNRPELLSQVQQFRTSFRRNLTIDDFNDTWDVGFKS